jgi:hypothetical protein
VKKTRRHILVTRFGQPITEVVPARPPAANAGWVGCMKGRARITGDVVGSLIAIVLSVALTGCSRAQPTPPEVDEEGRYPSQLSLSDVGEWDPVGSRSILRALSAIESYEQTDDRYSFTAVSARNEHRIRVVDGLIEE